MKCVRDHRKPNFRPFDEVLAIPLRRKKYPRPLSSTNLTSPEPSGIHYSIYIQRYEPEAKTLIAYKSPCAEIPFEEVLAKRLFLEALEAGLLGDPIASETKPLYKVPDKDLIFATIQACSGFLCRFSEK